MTVPVLDYKEHLRRGGYLFVECPVCHEWFVYSGFVHHAMRMHNMSYEEAYKILYNQK